MTAATDPAALVLRDQDRGDTFADPAAFAHWQRVAGMFAASEVIPQHLRGHLPDVLIGLDLARRLHLNPLSVLQNLYVVKGTPGWKTTFLLALAQSAGWDIDWTVEPRQPAQLPYKRRTKDATVDAAMPNLAVRCVMVKGGVRKVGPEVTSTQAIAAKWADNEQYVHSAELMLRYRAAAFAIRLYDPNVLLGLPSAEEAAEMADRNERVVIVPPDAQAPTQPARGLAAVDAALAGDVVDANDLGPQSAPPPEKPPTKPRPTPEQAAEILRDALAGRDRLSVDDARRALRTALDVRAITEDTWGRIDAHGRRHGWWHVVDNGRTMVLGPEAPTADRWAALDSRASLLDHIEAVSRKVGSQASAAALAEVSMTEADVEATEDMDDLRKLGRALDRQDAALRAEAGK